MRFLFIFLLFILTGCAFNNEPVIKEKIIYVNFLPDDNLFKKCEKVLGLGLKDYMALTDDEKDIHLHTVIATQNEQIRICNKTIETLKKYKDNILKNNNGKPQQ